MGQKLESVAQPGVSPHLFFAARARRLICVNADPYTSDKGSLSIRAGGETMPMKPVPLTRCDFVAPFTSILNAMGDRVNRQTVPNRPPVDHRYNLGSRPRGML